MPDVFLSYSRRNSAFVTRLADSLAARGKDVWVDVQGIADAEVFSEAIRRAIESSEAFLLVITPESVASPYCRQEVEYANELGKRIVPLRRAPVAEDALPAPVRERNWIPFEDDEHFQQSLERVVTALETDLDYRREHTRWLVKATEWEREGRDRAFLLRGSELAAAEAWLAGAGAGAEPAPSELQRVYLLDSRRANLTRQRRLAGGGLGVAAVAIALLVFALLSRSQAVSAEHRAVAAQHSAEQADRTASSQAFAAESENLLTTDPQSSVLLALRALHEAPTSQAMYAMREALDVSTVVRALPTAPAACQPLSDWDTHDGEILEETAQAVIGFDAATGRRLWSTPVDVTTNCSVAVDPAADLAVAADVPWPVLLDPRDGHIVGRLANPPGPRRGPPGYNEQYAFSRNGRYLAVRTLPRVELWNMSTRRGRVLAISPGVVTTSSDLAFSADSSQLFVVTSLGTIAVVDTATGRLIRTVRFGKPHATTIAIAVSPNGDTAAVATQALVAWAPCKLSLFDDRTWRQEAAISSFGPIPVTDLAFSPDGSRLAVGLDDGAASLWSVATRMQLLSFLGQLAFVANLAFNRDGSQLLVSGSGSNRVFRSSGPALATLQMPRALYASGPDLVVSHDTLSAFVLGLEGCSSDCEWDTWSWPGGRLLDRRIVSRDANLQFSQDGAAIAYFQLVRPGGNDWDAAIWSLTEQRLIRTVRNLPLGTVNDFDSDGTDAELTDDGQRFTVIISGPPGAGAGVTAAVRTYSVATGAVLASRTVRVTPPKGCPIDDDSIDELGTGIALWDECGQIYGALLDSSRPPIVVDVGPGVASVAADDAGTLVAAASWDGSVSVYSGRSGKRLYRVFVGTDEVSSVMFSPDGRYVVTTTLNGDVQTWDAATGALLQTQHDPYDPSVFAFASDGDPLTEDSDSSVRAWDLCTDCQNAVALARLGARAVVRPLTPAEQAQAG